MAMTTRFRTLAVLGLCLGLTLAGCGRKGSLDVPGEPATPETAAVETAAVEPATVVVVQPDEPASDERFFLDFLIR